MGQRMGQSHGPGPQGPQMGGPPMGGPPGGNPYTVQHGDTLWNIADRMRAAGDQRGNWDIVDQIARDNSLHNPDLILPGSALNLGGPLSPDGFVPSKDPANPLTGNAAGTPGAQGDGV